MLSFWVRRRLCKKPLYKGLHVKAHVQRPACKGPCAKAHVQRLVCKGPRAKARMQRPACKGPMRCPVLVQALAAAIPAAVQQSG